jgi:ABC-type sulfate/molybdate transport systems ATPase subunit
VIVSHDPGQTSRIAAHVLMLHSGRLTGTSPAEITSAGRAP